jgi:hypothetical protein
MPDITPKRDNIVEQEVDFKSGIAERTWFKIGAALNFVNKRQHQIHSFNYNGLSRLFVDTVGADGVFPCLFDMEIVGLSVFQRRGGTSSSTIIDMEWYDAPGSNQGTIYTTKPSVTSAGGDFNYLVYNALTDTSEEIGTGFTAPLFSKTQFDKGNVINCIIDQAMPDAEDLMVMIHHRPR